MGGDKINYPDDCGTPTADLLTVQLLLNSVISTPEAKFMIMDIKNFYLNTPLKTYKYLHLKMDDIPEDVWQVYELKEKAMQTSNDLMWPSVYGTKEMLYFFVMWMMDFGFNGGMVFLGDMFLPEVAGFSMWQHLPAPMIRVICPFPTVWDSFFPGLSVHHPLFGLGILQIPSLALNYHLCTKLHKLCLFHSS